MTTELTFSVVASRLGNVETSNGDCQCTRPSWRGLVHSPKGIHVPLNGCVRFAPFSFPALQPEGKMTNSKHSYAIIATIIAISMSAIVMALAASKNNALKAKLRAENDQISALQAQLSQFQRASIQQNNAEQVAQDDENLHEAIAGIYEFDPGEGRMPEQMDLRSDGSGFAWELYDYTQKLNQRPVAWVLSQDNSIIWVGRNPFKPEGDDLIDSKGNRWERER
jgi:hypothetical protein